MDKVIYEKRNRIGYVTLNRPDALNALDDELNEELWSVWDDYARDDALDVAIVTGAGKAFDNSKARLRGRVAVLTVVSEKIFTPLLT